MHCFYVSWAIWRTFQKNLLSSLPDLQVSGRFQLRSTPDGTGRAKNCLLQKSTDFEPASSDTHNTFRHECRPPIPQYTLFHNQQSTNSRNYYYISILGQISWNFETSFTRSCSTSRCTQRSLELIAHSSWDSACTLSNFRSILSLVATISRVDHIEMLSRQKEVFLDIFFRSHDMFDCLGRTSRQCAAHPSTIIHTSGSEAATVPAGPPFDFSTTSITSE